MKKKLRGVILAGGTGSRLIPLTRVTNKHLLPVGRKPMIYYPIEKLTGAGITDILIVTGIEHMGAVVSLLGSGKDFLCKFTYKVQDESGGIAQALGLAEEFASGDPVVVILGDNIFEDSLIPYVKQYLDNGAKGAQILIKEVDDPTRFGVPEIKDDKIISIEEKPLKPKSNFAVTGIYFYDSDVYSCIKNLKPSQRNEFEITDVNNFYISKNALSWGLLKGWWSDAGTFESLSKVQKLVEVAPPK
ncbi:MAG TPA: sugar phosphate nucleotidyltransferase [Victivallales bacterium]|nr:sugar phosphate nucleotidyltransferase [Victivallales bacterium]HRR28594.1 sugar phosphate nucleotidyltransferase [Victivallales bacterium]HRU01835.1 sugar phosphate nucleotidyltransferase [Victivallales bacterium]